MMVRRICKFFLTSVSLVALLCATYAQSSKPRTFFLDANVLAQTREAIRTGEPEYKVALKRLTREADKALKRAPVSVMAKKQTPPSGDKHDYMSLAPYWWPDPTKPDGLPYIRRDGEVNPERDECTDKQHLMTLTSHVRTIALAYYYTANESYAAHVIAMLRTWFLNPETRMNPNLNFGQAIRGRNDGRGAGLIEISRFRYIMDAIGLLETSSAWTKQDSSEMRKWFNEYFVWLRTSPNGVDEAGAKNNHGTWYDVQTVSIALFLGDTNTARTILREAKSKRIAKQVEPDGRMPLELVRTKALGYCSMNLEGLFYLATLAEREGIDLWHFSTNDGRGIKQALDWLLPFYADEKKWTYKQIKTFDYEYVFGMLARASVIYSDNRYVSVAQKIPNAAKDAQDALLLYGSIKRNAD